MPYKDFTRIFREINVAEVHAMSADYEYEKRRNRLVHGDAYGPDGQLVTNT